MTRALTVSIDAMGGDAGPAVVVSALLKTIQRHSAVNFVLHGDEAELNPLVARHPKLRDRVTVRHAPGRVTMEDKPSHVLRRGKDTSMWHTINCVKEGDADVAEDVVPADRAVTLASVGDLSLNTSPLPLLGTVTSRSEANIKAESSGKLAAVYKKLGDYVSAGEVIAEFDNGAERAPLHHDGHAAQGLAELVGNQPSDDVGGAAGRKPDNERDRLAGYELRRHGLRTIHDGKRSEQRGDWQ